MAQNLLDAKEQACQGVAELQQVEAKLQKASEEDTHLKASLLYPFLFAQSLAWEVRGHSHQETILEPETLGPRWLVLAHRQPSLQIRGSLTACFTQLARELEDLKEIEADLEKQEKETDEDTTVTIPAAV